MPIFNKLNKCIPGFRLIIIFVIATQISCSKEEAEFRTPEFCFPAFTGYNLIDSYGNFISKVGSPDEFLSTNTQPVRKVAFYPNPCSTTLHITLWHLQDPVRIWLTPAKWGSSSEEEVTQFANTNTLELPGSPVIAVLFTGGSGDMVCDITSLPQGYYRINITSGNDYFYGNLVINRNLN